MSADAVEARGKLEEKVTELGRLGDMLADLERKTEETQREYDAFMEDHELGVLARYEEQGKRLPSERLRERMARAEMPADLLGRYEGYRLKHARLTKRIDTLSKEVNGWRSILSALKEEAQGAGVGSYGRRAA